MNETALLDRIRDGGHDACVIATYNVYFPFFEGVVLPRLQAVGCRHNVLLADAGELARTLIDPATRPVVAGRKYTLIPVAASGAFHPKIVLLVGKKKATLHIGSHNLTYAGWTHNKELTTTYGATSADAPNAATLRAAWRFLRDWAELAPTALLASLDAVEELLPWLAGDDLADTELFGSRRTGSSLWNRVRAHLPARARRVLVTGPFFDAGCSFVRTVQRDLGADEMVIAIDPGSVSMDGTAMRSLKSTRLVAAPKQADDRPAYLHAKSLLIETGDGHEVLVVGSANPTAAAWLTGGATEDAEGWRNAEAVVVRSGPSGALSKPLGLDAWWTAQDVTAEELRQIRPAGTEPGAGQSSGSMLVAIATDDGFELPVDPRLDLGVDVQLIDSKGISHSRSLDARPAGWIVKEPSERSRFQTSLLRIGHGETHPLARTRSRS